MATSFLQRGCLRSKSGGALPDAGSVGGTSVAAPSMAGIQALIDQANGGRQGAPNYIYYASSAAQNTANCNSITPRQAASTCAFNDITAGDNLICGIRPARDRRRNQDRMPGRHGYDLATDGLCEPANLSSQWKNVTFNSSTTTLSVSQTTGHHPGQPVTFSGTVAPGRWGRPPAMWPSFLARALLGRP